MTHHESAISPEWAQAVTLDDVGELTAQWLDGTLTTHPAYGAEPDPETEGLKEVLARCNRAGFVTDFSQPGEVGDDQAWKQRAAVSGYCTAPIAISLDALGVSTDLVVIALATGTHADIQLPVTISENRPYTWIGGRPPREELHHEFSGMGAFATKALEQAWYVTVVDPQWGRNDLLWSALESAVTLPTTDISLSIFGSAYEWHHEN